MSLNMQALSKLISESEYNTKYPMLESGSGIAIVKGLKLFEGRKGPTFVAELLIEEGGDVKNPVGSVASFLKVIAGANEGFLAGLVRQMIEVLNDEPADAQTLELATSDAQPCRGMRIRYTTTDKITKEKKIPIKEVIWSSFPNTEATVTDGRAKLQAAGV